MSRPGIRRVGVVDVALLAVAITWGSSYLGAKTVVTPQTVAGFLAIRFAIAVVCLALPLLPRLRRTSRHEVQLGILYGCILATIFILETVGVIGTTASNAGLIISLTMLLTPVLEGRFKRTRMPREFYAACALAFVGLAMLTQAQGFAVPTWGDGLILLAAVARAVHVTVIDATSKSMEIDSARVTIIQLTVVLVVLALGSTVIGSSTVEVARAFSMLDWAVTIYLALACTVFAFFVQMWAVRRTSPSRVSLLLGTEPMWAAAVGIGIGGEPLTVTVLTGAACVLAGTSMGRNALTETDNRHAGPSGTSGERKHLGDEAPVSGPTSMAGVGA